jgi:hypothetical protein
MVVLDIPTLIMLGETSATSDVQYYCVIFRMQVRPQVGMAMAQQLVRPQHLTHLQGLSRTSLQKLLPQLMLKLKYTHHCQVSKTLSVHTAQITQITGTPNYSRSSVLARERANETSHT